MQFKFWKIQLLYFHILGFQNDFVMSEFEKKPSNDIVHLESYRDDRSDVVIICIDCEHEFNWSRGEQAFFKDKGLNNQPKRCKPCKNAKNERIRAIKNAKNGGDCRKIAVAVFCVACNKHTTVPFYPSQGRAVYCRSCYLEQNPG